MVDGFVLALKYLNQSEIKHAIWSFCLGRYFVNTSQLKNIVIVGAGTMGHSIALAFAKANLNVCLVDINNDILNHARSLIKSELGLLLQCGYISSQAIESIFAKINFTTSLKESVNDCDFVVETVSENPQIKQKIFDQLDEFCPAKTIFSSNTSTLDVFSIIKMKRLDRFLMLHWFNPAHIIPLVEISVSEKTSEDTLKTAKDMMTLLGKKVVTLKKFTPSLIVNRIQLAIEKEAFNILGENVASAQDVDLAIKACLGVRLPIVGILQSLDFTGLKLVSEITKHHDSLIENLITNGNLGASTGKGIYDYKGKTEEEVINKRDKLYLELLAFLQKINAFEPV